jgi:competence protein ComEC
MAAAPANSGARPADAASVWQAPLVPVALAVTAGIVLDRYLAIPPLVSLTAAALALVAGVIALLGPRRREHVAFLLLAAAALAGAYHRIRLDVYPADDVGRWAPEEPKPVQVRGVLAEEPLAVPARPADPLRAQERGESVRGVLRLTALRQGEEWVAVSGRVQLLAPGAPQDMHLGDEVEAVGQLVRVGPPSNPGEFDYVAQMNDQGVHAYLMVRKTAAGLTRLERRWPESLGGWLAVTRGRGQRELAEALPPRSRGLAMALLLGEGSPLTADDWLKYVRTGVIHVLAISGQHLVVLAVVLWWLLRRFGVRQRHGAAGVALFLLTYALLTGGRPPALRSAVVVCAAAGGLLLRRRTVPANLFALAWLAVALLNPADLFGAGCLLSFLSVAVLYWGTGHWFGRREPDPLDQLIDETRPPWLRCLRRFGAAVAESYLVTAVIWLAVTPLAASRYHVVALTGIPLGPPLTLLTAIALLAGFLLLALASLGLPFTAPFAWVVDVCLALCEWLVDLFDRWSLSHLSIGDVPEWWLWLVYLTLLAWLTQVPLRRRWRWGLVAGAGWLCVGLLSGAARLPSDELRCTFLAVGHGGCTVLELPDGRVLVYDAGAITGPEVTRRQIAPFLWARGVRRIDELFLSHADLDHFNGLPSLLDYFAVGQVTCTPTFADKHTPGVGYTLDLLARRRIPIRIVKAGDRLTAGAVGLEVLHPPAVGPEGNENTRSLVLRVRHENHTILLTGDLEGVGLERVLATATPPIDILMAPHHGSHRIDTAGLAKWARPRLIVSCQGAPRSPAGGAAAYRAVDAPFLATWDQGAVTIRSHRTGLVAETFRTGKRIALRAPAGAE